MVLKLYRVGDIIRKLREHKGLTVTALASKAGVKPSLVLNLERHGAEVEGITPLQWRALDRLAEVFGLRNGASFYKLVPEPVDTYCSLDSGSVDQKKNRVLPFTQRN